MNFRHTKPWLSDDDEALRNCAAQGISVARIAVRLKRAEKGVRKRAATLKLLLPTKRESRVANGLPPNGAWKQLRS